MMHEPGFYSISRQWVPKFGPMTWRRVYPGRADKASVARKFAAFLLADSGRGDEAEFIAAELVSNALLYTRSGHAEGWFGVQVVLGKVACIAVRDIGGGGVPVISAGSGDELREHGRGLLAVSQLALTVGFDGDPVTGHTVWAELDVHKKLSSRVIAGTVQAETSPVIAGWSPGDQG